MARMRMLYHPKPAGDMRDGIGIPDKMSKNEAINYIVKIASDEGSHVILKEALDWAELKLLAIKKIASKIQKKA